VYQLWLMKVMQEEREREIETAIRVRRLLRPQDGVTEPASPRAKPATGSGPWPSALLPRKREREGALEHLDTTGYPGHESTRLPAAW
jgi:hypothetical protein